MKNLIIAILLFVLAVCPIVYEPPKPTTMTPSEVAEKVLPSVVLVERMTKHKLFVGLPGKDPIEIGTWETLGVGTGTIVGDGGYVATCSHVVDRADRIVVWVDGQVAPVETVLIYNNPSLDMSILKLDTVRKFKPVQISLIEPKIGDTVHVAGFPFELGKSFTTGTVNRLNDTHAKLDSIVFDAVTNPGNSGGPLFDSKGRLIGVVWGIYSPRIEGPPAWNGIGFAFPVKRLAEQLPDAYAAGAALVSGIDLPPTP